MKLLKTLFALLTGLSAGAYFNSATAQQLAVYNDIANYIKEVAPGAENEYFSCWYFTGDPNKICATQDRFRGKNIPSPYYCPVNYAGGGGYTSHLDCWVATLNAPLPLKVIDRKCTPDPNHPATTIRCSDPYILKNA